MSADRTPAVELTCPIRQLIEAFPDAVLVLDAAGRIRSANARAGSLFGHAPDALVGRALQGLLPDPPTPLVPARRGRAAEEPAARRWTGIACRSDGRGFPAEVTAIPVATRQGPFVLVAVRDMTDTQRIRSALERSLAVLVTSGRDRQYLLDHLVRAQEDERRRIAAGIHDDTVQVISAAHLRVQQLRNRLHEPGEIAIVDKLDEILQLSLDRLRQLIFDLRPPGLDQEDLATALATDLDDLRGMTGIAYELDDQLTTTVPPRTALLIYRNVREALENVRKHARATTVRVSLADLDDGYLVQITDDGAGYDPGVVESRPGHLGLVLMRERPLIAGGWCRIESAPGAGTSVEFWIPAAPPPRQEPAA